MPSLRTAFVQTLTNTAVAKTLVTGATGFIGSELVRQLVTAGEEVAILRRASSRLDLLQNVAEQIEHRIGDVTNPDDTREAIHGIERVYHTAAFVGFGGKRDDLRLFEVNVGGTAHVVNAALDAGVERLVHTSSIAALGRPATASDTPIDEGMEWQTSPYNTAYARSKRDAELEVHRAIAEGLDAVIVNPALVFGPGREGENTMKIVGQIRAQKLPGVPVGGTCVVDVSDVAAGHRLAMQRGNTGERYVLGGQNLSWADIVHTLAEALNVSAPRRTLSPRLALFAATLAEGFASITRTRPLLTRETARISAHTSRYSNQKARAELGATFRPFNETATRIATTLGRTVVRPNP